MRARRLLGFLTAFASSASLAAIACSSGDATSSSNPALDASCPDAIVAPSLDSSLPGDAGGDAGIDAGDASANDAPIAPDVIDAAPSPLVCAPRPIGFPGWSPPIAPIDACSSGDIDTILSDCAFAYDDAKCQQDQTSLAACFGCIFTPNDADRWGAIVEYYDDVYINFGGCLAIELGDTSPTSCGAARGAFDDCARSSCDRCWGADAGTIEGGIDTVFSECFETAIGDGGLCATQEQAYRFTCPPTSVAYRVCFEQQGEIEQDYFHRVVSVFCSAGDAGAPSDAGGMDASDGGP